MKKQHLPEIIKLRRELEHAKKKISNLSQQINTLLLEKHRFWSPRRCSSGSDKTTVDWRGKLEMEKGTGLGHAHSQTGSQNQVQSVNVNRGRGETRAKNIAPHTSCAIPYLSSGCPMKDVSQIILPYQNAMVAPPVATSQDRPAEVIYKHIPQTLARLMSHEQHCFEDQFSNTSKHYVNPNHSQFCVQPNNNNTLTSISYIYNYQTQVY